MGSYVLQHIKVDGSLQESSYGRCIGLLIKGLLSKLFGPQTSSCCNMRIKEVIGEEKKSAGKKEIGEKSQTQQSSSCCNTSPTRDI